MKKYKKLIISALSFLGLSAITIAFIFGLHIYSHQKIVKGTYVSGIDLSYLSEKEASDTLTREYNQYLDHPIHFTAEHKNVYLTPRELGISFPVEDLVKSAEKHDNTKSNLIDYLFSEEKNTIEPIINIDEEVFNNQLRTTLTLDDLAPVNANFYMDGQKLSIKEGEKGFAVNKEDLLASLQKSAEELSNKDIALNFQYGDPEVTPEVLEGHRESVTTALFHKFDLIDPVYSDDWTENLVIHPEWPVFEPSLEKVTIKINPEPFNTYIDAEIAEWLDREAGKVTLKKDPDHENSKIIIEGEGNDGSKILRGQLISDLEYAIANLETAVPIPVETIEPQITIAPELQELGIIERVGLGHTSYYGSPANRVHNIKVAAENFNGMTIAPGETFSFNHNLGPVDASTGYRKELVIKPEGTIPEYGGGVCQVSTTLYRAVLLTGLPIAERHQHSYAVSYYSQILGHGLDATIYLGGPDFQFTNDTAGTLAVQAYTKNDYELYFVFYGTKPGRSVEMDGPYLSGYHNPGPTIYEETTSLAPGQTKQVEKAHTGFTAVWYRTVTDENTGEVEKETITTKYKAVPAKILVGAGG